MDMIHKDAPGGGGGLTFVLSDETKDRYGDVIVASGWDLRNFRRNPVALFGHSHDFPVGTWTGLRIEGNKLLGDLKLAAKGTSARLDELISLVEQGILRAVSVGFKPIDKEPIDKNADPNWGPFRYLKQELLETSLVSVPANPSALAVAKSLNVSDDTLRMAFGEHAGRGQPADGRGLSGEHAVTQSSSRSRTMELSRPQRIEKAQTDLNNARDALKELVAQDGYDIAQEEELSAEVKKIEGLIVSLKRAEDALAAKTLATNSAAAPALRRPLGVQPAEPKPADLIIRAAVVRAVAHATGKDIDDVLEQRYPGHEATSIVTKTDATVATTTTSGWASELVNTAMGEFINTLKPMSVLPGLMEAGTALTFNNSQGAIKLPSRVAGTNVNGSFVLEGAPIPVRRITTTSVTLSPHKMGVISTFTKELARYSTPAIEGLLRSEIMADTAVALDTVLLDATIGSTTRPAGLRYNVAALTAYGGTDYTAVLADLNALMAPFDTANAGRNMVFIMNPAQRRALSMMPGPDGTFGWAEKFFGNARLLTSTTVGAGVIIAVDAADFAAAYGGAEFDVSEQATIHMEDTTALPLHDGSTPADPVRSLWQTASIGIRMILPVTWAMRRDGMVRWMTVNW